MSEDNDVFFGLSVRAMNRIADVNEWYENWMHQYTWDPPIEKPKEWRPIRTREDVRKALLDGTISTKVRNLGNGTLKELCEFAGLDFEKVRKLTFHREESRQHQQLLAELEGREYAGPVARGKMVRYRPTRAVWDKLQDLSKAWGKTPSEVVEKLIEDEFKHRGRIDA